MDALFDFLTVLAWIGLFFGLARTAGILTNKDNDTAQLVRIAEFLGYNPIGDALKAPVILAIISVVWLSVTW